MYNTTTPTYQTGISKDELRKGATLELHRITDDGEDMFTTKKITGGGWNYWNIKLSGVKTVLTYRWTLNDELVIFAKHGNLRYQVVSISK